MHNKAFSFGIWKISAVSTRCLVMAGCAIATFAFLVPRGEVRAQGALGLTVRPAIIEQRVNPGETFRSSFTAKNIGGAEKTFYIVIRNISGLNDAGRPIFAEGEALTGYELSSWITVTSDSFVIGANQEMTVPFSVKVPVEATPGGHFGGIFLLSKPVAPGQTGTGIGYEVGMVLSLRIAGNTVEEAQIRQFAADRDVYGSPSAKFAIRIENLGNVLVRPHGVVEVTDFFGKKVATIRINDIKAAVFPKTVRQYDAEWAGTWYSFGRHQATLSLVYGDDSRKTISSTLSFWVLPLKIILPALGGILAFILIVTIVVNLHIKRKIREIYRATPGLAGRKPVGAMPANASPISAAKAPISRLSLVVTILIGLAIAFMAMLFVLFA